MAGYKICTICTTPTSFSSSLRFLFYRHLLLSLYLSFSFSLFFSIALSFSCAKNYTRSLYEIAHTTVARDTTRYQMCKAQAIIHELVSIVQGNRKDNGLQRNASGEQEAQCLYLFNDALDPLLVVPSFLTEMFEKYSNGQRSFETSQRTPKSESVCESYAQNSFLKIAVRWGAETPAGARRRLRSGRSIRRENAGDSGGSSGSNRTDPKRDFGGKTRTKSPNQRSKRWN